MKQAAILDVASSAGKLIAVNEFTISSHAYAAACAPGGACCASGPSRKGYGPGWWKTPCCATPCVRAWLDKLQGARHSAAHAHQEWADRRGNLAGLFAWSEP